MVLLDSVVSFSNPWIVASLAIVITYVLFFRSGKKQKVEGSVFVTGCDSGMGEITAQHLAELGFHVFAGVYLDDSLQKLKKDNIVPVKIDVTKEESIRAALSAVENHPKGSGLVGIVNCAGMGFTGPAEYFPLQQYRQQLEVNLLGYIAVTQAFLPLLKQNVNRSNAPRRGRIIFVGTGGGVPSACPALLSAYMASKWGVEAFCQSLRLELRLTKQNIDACMINPGFIKPTGLMAGGKTLLEKTWQMMPPRARTEYGGLVDTFLKFSEEQPGTHPRYVAAAMETAMTASRPLLRYRVGVDSKLSPIVGLLPTNWREALLAKSMFGQ